MDIAIKGILGGIITALIIFTAKRGNVLPGILPLLPVFAIIALLAVGAKGDTSGLKETCLAAGKTIPAYLAFLVVCYVLADRVDFRLAIFCALGAWFLAVAVIFMVPRPM
jgi:membrane protein GlpM